MAGIGIGQRFSEQLLSELRDMQTQVQSGQINSNNAMAPQDQGASGSSSFMDHMMNAVGEVNKAQTVSDKISSDLASGKSDNIHDAMLSSAKAELDFNLMVQVRNKVLEAYQEVMRMQV
jgi:flagellar hook-basal body complex protein FliE